MSEFRGVGKDRIVDRIRELPKVLPKKGKSVNII